MKRKTFLTLTLLTGALALTGCQNSGDGYAKYVKLGDYKGLTVDRSVTPVTDEDVQEEIQNELDFSAELIEVTDRAAQSADVVNIDFEGTIDGEPFEGGTETGYEYELDADGMIEGFDENIIGMNIGESKDFEVTFPDPYDGTLDGKTANFHVTLNSIYESDIPEYNDAYVKSNYDYDTTEEYEDYLRSELQSTYDEDSDYMALSELMSQIIEASTFKDAPEDLYNSVKTSIDNDNTTFADELGMEVADLMGDDYDLDAETQTVVNERLVVYAIAEKEKLKVSEDEIREFAEENYESYDADSAEDLIEDYGKETIEYDLLYNKVMDFLQENNTFNDVIASDEE
ncbi:MAG: trigger factor [Eubacteriales bacterium]|nr:trigger factor [Eubacteriales bacterium]